MNRNMRFRQLKHLISAVFFEIIREPGILFWGIVFPILLSMGLGLAFSKKADVTRRIALIGSYTNLNSLDSANVLWNLISRNAVAIPAMGDEPVYYKISLADKDLGNTLFLFSKTDWKNALIQLKRGKISLIADISGNKNRI